MMKRTPMPASRLRQPSGHLQRAAINSAAPDLAPPIVHDVLHSPGRPLDEAARGQMESRFGQDFSRVRVHTDAKAAESAQAVNALAYTVGQHIVFDTPKFSPTTSAGRDLLAHEIVHTMQQPHYSAQAANISIDRPASMTEQEAQSISRQYFSTGAGEIQHTNAQVARQTPETRSPGQASSPAAAASPLHVAGRVPPDQPYKIIRLAWTLDDGPTTYSQAMRNELGARSGTWFIMRNLLGTGQGLQNQLSNFARRQRTSREEIAIHSMHPTQGHVAWFPVQVSSGVPQAYRNINEAMQHLRDFTQLLRGAGLQVNFVRLPGGLISELSAYLGAQGIPTENRRNLADRIIRGEDITSTAPAAAPVQRDYRTLQTTLTSLDLHLWGGGSDQQETAPLSWEAESSGTGLTDNVTSKFNNLVDQFARVHRPRSLIVLAHDTARENAAEVGRDVAAMEAYASRNGVQVEYYNLSDLYRVIRNEEP